MLIYNNAYLLLIISKYYKNILKYLLKHLIALKNENFTKKKKKII